MKALIQRVTSASVSVDNVLISSIGKGILVFAAVGKDDTVREAEGLAGKVLRLRVWDGSDGAKWKHNVQDINGEILCAYLDDFAPPVSQFTLYASTNKGNKPSFHKSAAPEYARTLYDHFVRKVRDGYVKERVKDGVFQAMMQVALVNDGPVTLEIEANPPQPQPQPQPQSIPKQPKGPKQSNQETQPSKAAETPKPQSEDKTKTDLPDSERHGP